VTNVDERRHRPGEDPDPALLPRVLSDGTVVTIPRGEAAWRYFVAHASDDMIRAVLEWLRRTDCE
jgi:hypothetical protein